MVEDDVAGRVAGAVADVEGELADASPGRRRRASATARTAGRRCRIWRRPRRGGRSSRRSASCGPSIGTPSSSASMPALPQWSIWPWVSRIFSIVTPACCGRGLEPRQVAAGIDEGAAHRRGAPQQGAILLQRRHRDDRGARGAARSFGRSGVERRHRRRLVLHRCGDRFGPAQHAQHVAAGELGEVLVGPAAADQLGEQQWDSPATPVRPAGARRAMPSRSPPIPTWS